MDIRATLATLNPNLKEQQFRQGKTKILQSEKVSIVRVSSKILRAFLSQPVQVILINLLLKTFIFAM